MVTILYIYIYIYTKYDKNIKMEHLFKSENLNEDICSAEQLIEERMMSRLCRDLSVPIWKKKPIIPGLILFW